MNWLVFDKNPGGKFRRVNKSGAFVQTNRQGLAISHYLRTRQPSLSAVKVVRLISLIHTYYEKGDIHKEKQ